MSHQETNPDLHNNLQAAGRSPANHRATENNCCHACTERHNRDACTMRTLPLRGTTPATATMTQRCRTLGSDNGCGFVRASAEFRSPPFLLMSKRTWRTASWGNGKWTPMCLVRPKPKRHAKAFATETSTRTQSFSSQPESRMAAGSNCNPAARPSSAEDDAGNAIKSRSPATAPRPPPTPLPL